MALQNSGGSQDQPHNNAPVINGLLNLMAMATGEVERHRAEGRQRYRDEAIVEFLRAAPAVLKQASTSGELRTVLDGFRKLAEDYLDSRSLNLAAAAEAERSLDDCLKELRQHGASLRIAVRDMGKGRVRFNSRRLRFETLAQRIAPADIVDELHSLSTAMEGIQSLAAKAAEQALEMRLRHMLTGENRRIARPIITDEMLAISLPSKNATSGYDKIRYFQERMEDLAEKLELRAESLTKKLANARQAHKGVSAVTVVEVAMDILQFTARVDATCDSLCALVSA